MSTTETPPPVAPQAKSHWASTTSSQTYSTNRPPYQKAIYEVIFRNVTTMTFAFPNEENEEALAIKAAERKERPRRLLDIACGTGQIFQTIAKQFDEVIGVDTSETQLASAFKANNIKYVVGDAETFVLPDAWLGSVDLVTVGSALHWFDAQKFALHVSKYLRPGGVIAMWNPDYTLAEPHGSIAKEFRKWLTSEGLWPAAHSNRDNDNADQLPFFTAPGTGLASLGTQTVTNEYKDVEVKRAVAVYSTVSAVQNFNERKAKVLKHREEEGKVEEGAAQDAALPAGEYHPMCDCLKVFSGKLLAAGEKGDASMRVPIHLFRKE